MRCTMSKRLYMRWNNCYLSWITITGNTKWYSTIYYCSVRMRRSENVIRRSFCFRHLQDNLIKRVPRDGSFRRLRSLRTLYVIEISLFFIRFSLRIGIYEIIIWKKLMMMRSMVLIHSMNCKIFLIKSILFKWNSFQ